MTNETELIPLRKFAAANGVSVSGTYNLIKAGKLVAVKNGPRTLITGESAKAWRQSLPRFVPMNAEAEVADEAR